MEHKELISELTLYKERLELTLIGTNCGTWYHDFNANIIHYDERAKQLLGIDKSSVNYEDWFSFIHPDDVGRVSKTIKEKLDLKEPHVNIIYRVIVDDTIKLPRRYAK